MTVRLCRPGFPHVLFANQLNTTSDVTGGLPIGAGRPAGPVEGQTQTFSEKRKPYRYSRGCSFAVIRLSKSASADQDPDKGHSEPASDKIRSRLSSRLRPFALVKHKSLPVINPPASSHLLNAYIDQLLQPFWSGSRPITRRACASRRC